MYVLFLFYFLYILDIDECELALKACGSNAQCVNLFGGAECECCAGYSKNPQGTCSRKSCGVVQLELNMFQNCLNV